MIHFEAQKVAQKELNGTYPLLKLLGFLSWMFLSKWILQVNRSKTEYNRLPAKIAKPANGGPKNI